MEKGCEKIAELGPLSEEGLKEFAGILSSLLEGGEVLILSGDLGSGKTTFVKGMAPALGIPEDMVRSPTFTLINVYPGRLVLNHVDLYRIEDIEQLFYLGLEEMLEEREGILVVEWGDSFEDFWDDRLLIEFKVVSDSERRLILHSCMEKGEEIIREAIRRYEEESGQVR